MDSLSMIWSVTGGVFAVLVAATIGISGGWWAARRAAQRSRSDAPAAERIRLVERLAEAVVDLTDNLDHSDMLGRVARSAAALVGADAAAFVRLDGPHSTVVAVDRLPPELIGFTIVRGEGVVGDVIQTGQPLVIDDYQTHPHRIARIVEMAPDIHTAVVVPSVIEGNVSAVLLVLFHSRGRSISATELDVLRLLAGHAGTAVANAASFAEAVMREAHEQAVIEALADGVAVISPDGRITTWNSAAAAMTGVAVADALGRPPPVPVATHGHPIEHELPDDRWIEILTTPLPATGETVMVLRDVSEQKALERAQNLFLATTTHEIKTPLTVVSGFASTLLNRWGNLSADDRDRALSAIVRRSEALVKLIDQLLLGFRVQAGQLDLDLRALDVRPLLESAVSGFDTITESHRVLLDVADGLPLVIGDARAVDQVLSQLLENAIKYSPEGGTVRVGAMTRNGSVVVSVHDEGIGLEPGEGERVFSRYFRGSGKSDRSVGGVGLGLYIVRQLVEAQGGAVRASGTPGGGSTFEFTLPVAR